MRVFSADVVVLVEGEDDRVAIHAVAKLLESLPAIPRSIGYTLWWKIKSR